VRIRETLELADQLLELLEAGVYFPLGSAKAHIADIWIIAATNVDLDAAVRERRFREDLYYRLCVAQIHLPNLASRPEDIAPLAQHFCASACRRRRLPDLQLSEGLLRALEQRRWAGNVRELKHRIEAACIRCGLDGKVNVELTHMSPASSLHEPAHEIDLNRGFQEATRQFQSLLVRRVLDAEAGNVSSAARRLSVSRARTCTP
jgi:Nif-specific regulatory protein